MQAGGEEQALDEQVAGDEPAQQEHSAAEETDLRADELRPEGSAGEAPAEQPDEPQEPPAAVENVQDSAPKQQAAQTNNDAPAQPEPEKAEEQHERETTGHMSQHTDRQEPDSQTQLEQLEKWPDEQPEEQPRDEYLPLSPELAGETQVQGADQPNDTQPGPEHPDPSATQTRETREAALAVVQSISSPQSLSNPEPLPELPEIPNLPNSQNLQSPQNQPTQQNPAESPDPMPRRSPKRAEPTIEPAPLARSAYQYLHISGPPDQSADAVDRRFREAIAASRRTAVAREAQWTAAQERARLAEEADERARAEREAERARLLERRREENRELRVRVRERQRDLEAKTRAVRKPKASYSPAAVVAELRAEREQGPQEEDYRSVTLGELRARAGKAGPESPQK